MEAAPFTLIMQSGRWESAVSRRGGGAPRRGAGELTGSPGGGAGDVRAGGPPLGARRTMGAAPEPGAEQRGRRKPPPRQRSSRLRPTEVAVSAGGQSCPQLPAASLVPWGPHPRRSALPRARELVPSNPNLKLGLRPGDLSGLIWFQIPGLRLTQVSLRRAEKITVREPLHVRKSWTSCKIARHPGKMVRKN